jgi:hypothetical protein
MPDIAAVEDARRSILAAIAALKAAKVEVPIALYKAAHALRSYASVEGRRP